jgi:hypothetical protein
MSHDWLSPLPETELGECNAVPHYVRYVESEYRRWEFYAKLQLCTYLDSRRELE